MKGQLYAVVAKLDGSTKMRMIHSFGLGPSPDAMMDKVRKRLAIDHDFKQLWTGWVFGVMLADNLIKVEPTGAVLMFQNDKEAVH